MQWDEDPRVPYLIAAILGMVAGVVAKQAVTLSSGEIPRPIAILADFMILGMILIIVMYLHSVRPDIPLEGISLISSGLALWGPKGIVALSNRLKAVMLDAAQSMAKKMIEPVDPVHRPTVVKEEETGLDKERTSPISKLRDKIPLEDKLPLDQVELLSQMDKRPASDDEANKEGNN